MTTHVVIVGAGIIGLAHAVEARRAGHTVTVVERDARAVGASIRNFGHVCTTAQPDSLLPLALRSREGWLRTAEAAGLDILTEGTLVVARSPEEMTVLEALAAKGDRDARILTVPEVRQRLGGLGGNSILGGAHLPHDLRTDPRAAIPALAAWLAADDGVTFHWSTTCRDIAATQHGVRVHTSRGTLDADRALICVGHDLDRLAPQIAADGGVRRCRLSMMRVETPGDVHIGPAVLTATGIARYGAFADAADIAPVRRHIDQRNDELLAIVANAMATQAPDGTLRVGDTHHYDDVAPPFMDEGHSETLLAEMAATLGADELRVVERWQGVYADSPQQDVLRAPCCEGADTITVTGGVGMTLSFGLAAETFV